MTHTLIYPHTTAHNAAGHLEIGGCDVVDLAREFGTPLFIYDEQTLRDQCRAYHTAFGARTDLYEIVYASKAFSCRAMAELAAQEDMSLDVATGGELAAALAAGFPPGRIYFHGNNKSVAEIEAASGRRHRPLRRRLVRGDRAAGGGGRRPRPRAGRARARHAGRAPQHARLHPDRPAGQQVRLRAGRRARARGGAPPQGRAPPRARRRARAHRLADLRARLVPARGRGALRRHRRVATRLRLRVPHLQHRRRARASATPPPTSPARSRSSPRSPSTRSATAPSSTACRCHGCSSSRGGASPARRPSPRTRSGPSRSSPACAPTWPWTAA